ncbi:MAG: biotin--[acetyl-CoA-carboxylase] ligase [Rhodospirillales bacterium]|nr:biotin--[acetyl-CoA-carboxylase] ligase [Rhodospirillales bacterium]
MALARAGAPEFTLVWAKRQTAGRGRQGRPWDSPAGNLHSSLILRPEVAPSRAPEIGFAVALSVADAVGALLPGAASQFKWPNDVLLGGAKLAGILLESSGIAGGRIEALIVGMGMNVAQAPAGTPYPAAALAERDPHVTVEAALGAYAEAFLGWYRRWQRDGFTPIREAWLAKAAGLGGPIAVNGPQGPIQGIFAGLDDDGALLLDGGRRVLAGDVFPMAQSEK